MFHSRRNPRRRRSAATLAEDTLQPNTLANHRTNSLAPLAHPQQEQIAAADPETDDAEASIEVPKPFELKGLSKKHPREEKFHLGADVLLDSMAMALHSDAVAHFIATRGFGFSRMGPTVVLVQQEWKRHGGRWTNWPRRRR